ncbi:hypothetical protein A4A49_26303 [Nicotiana attenuata]|uniref:Uncharacterized protein n=1 Tax=Nicotiana attenuata TaxID=49451 RepID=A0A314KZP1_NICAT|nr:hypothetical protein A4A49_26303 [Nicotiana attenuata]
MTVQIPALTDVRGDRVNEQQFAGVRGLELAENNGRNPASGAIVPVAEALARVVQDLKAAKNSVVDRGLAGESKGSAIEFGQLMDDSALAAAVRAIFSKNNAAVAELGQGDKVEKRPGPIDSQLEANVALNTTDSRINAGVIKTTAAHDRAVQDEEQEIEDVDILGSADATNVEPIVGHFDVRQEQTDIQIKTWADQVEYEAEEQQVNTPAAISVHDRHEAAPTPGQQQLIENNSGTNQFNTTSSKAATRKKNKKVHPYTHVFVPSGQKQNASPALTSQQLLKDDKKELSPAAHQITNILAGMKEIELSAGREKQQISGVTLNSNTTVLQFSSPRMENVIKDAHLMTKHENKLTGKLKSKLNALDFIPRKPPGGTCIHNVVTP